MDNATKGWLLIGAVLMGLAVFAGVAIITPAVLLAIIIMIGLITTWTGLPRWLKLFFTLPGIRWVLDALLSFAVPLLMLRTLTGIFAGAILGIMVTAALEVEALRLRGKAI